MTEAPRLSFRQKFLIAAISVPVYVGLAVGALAIVTVNDHQTEARIAAQKSAEVERAVDNCQRRNELAGAIKELVARATAPSDAAMVGLTTLTAYAALDPEVQVYLAELQDALLAASHGGSTDALIEFADHLKREDCSALRNDLEDQGEG